MNNAKPWAQSERLPITAEIVKLPWEINRARQLRKRLHMIRTLLACLKESHDA